MAVRQVRGFFPGTLAQPRITAFVHEGLPNDPAGGKITVSGLITVPLTGPGRLGPALQDPVTMQVPVGILPTGSQTREASRLQTTPRGNGTALLWLTGAWLLLF